MTDRDSEERKEKLEKREEKQEGSSVEKWRSDPLRTVVWALILIWAGLVFLADNMGLFAWIRGIDTWGLVFAGAGVILLLEAGARYLLPEYRRPVMATVILGLVLIVIGLGDLLGWNFIWPLVLMGIGAAMLLSGLFRRRE